MKLPSLLFGLFLLSCGGDGDGSSAAGGGGASGGVSGSGGASGNGGAGTGGSAGSGSASSGLGLGLLPLRVTHNLETDTCLATSSCSANVEVESEEAAFLKKVEADVNLPVLHWDRAIPWLAFTETAPTGSDRVAFYDAKLDPALRDWLNAFDVYFAALGGGYVALTPLHGSRDKLKQLRLPDGSEVDVGNVCNDVSPGTIVTLDLSAKGLGTVQLDIATAFRNFVLYVHDKLEPSYLAIGIELTLFEKSCPAEWPGLVSLYQSTYDAVRAEVPAATKIFATLTAQELLGFDHDACFGAFDFQPCSGPAGASYAAFDDAKCFPLHTQPIDDLDAGGRLDVLALSFYPDGFLTKRSGLENGLLEIWPSATGGTGDCALHAELPPAVDPIAALAKLGWKKPIAIAETSARSCESWTWLKAATGDLTLRVPGNDAAQTAWLEAMTGAGKDQSWLFVIGSFYADYPPMGPWIPAQDPAILDPFTFQAFNAFPCMGLYTPAGAPKASQLAVWKQALTP